MVNIFELMELAKTKKNAISMGLGDPDLATPSHIVAAAKQAIDEGRTGPVEPTGLLELRQAISRKLARDNGVEADPESEILVTTGGQEALFLLIQALMEPGDEVIVPDPRYTSYDDAIALAGGKMVLVPTDEAHSFELDPDEVEAAHHPAYQAAAADLTEQPDCRNQSPGHGAASGRDRPGTRPDRDRRRDLREVPL